MNYVLFALVILLVVVLAVAVLAVRRPRRAVTQPPPPTRAVEDDLEARRMRRRALEGQQDELLTRRVQLDQRRGTLGGDIRLYDALDRLERSYQAGDISEDEFEAEKIRLLGG